MFIFRENTYSKFVYLLAGRRWVFDSIAAPNVTARWRNGEMKGQG